jgi:CRP/FNR family transcriptional regulator, cyclic AMP receptor protein
MTTRTPGFGAPIPRMKSDALTNEVAPSDAQVVRVLEFEPELARGLSGEDLDLARRYLVARVELLPPGDWLPPWPGQDDLHGQIGFLLLDGLVMRTQRVGSVAPAELLGSGDVLRPWQIGDEGSSFESEPRWQVLQPTRVAILDRRFARVAGRWPEVLASLMDRGVQRSRLLAFQMGIGHLRRVDARLLLLFWRLSDRWGRVTRDGVVLPLALTHGWLANLVGAQRPSVTTALGTLTNAGRVERLEDGSWLLRGGPPDPTEPLFAASASAPNA